jgi:hypothetical protein
LQKLGKPLDFPTLPELAIDKIFTLLNKVQVYSTNKTLDKDKMSRLKRNDCKLQSQIQSSEESLFQMKSIFYQTYTFAFLT